MEIVHEETPMKGLLKLNEQNPIAVVRCNEEEFEELFEEAKEAGILGKSDEYWFSIKGVNFSVHLAT